MVCNIAMMKRFLPLLIWVGCKDDSDENPLYGLWEFDQLYTISGDDTLGLVSVDEPTWYLEISENNYKEYHKNTDASPICYNEGHDLPAVISELGDNEYQIDVISGGTIIGIKIEIDGDRLFWDSSIDAIDGPAASAIKLNTNSLTPLCQ